MKSGRVAELLELVRELEAREAAFIGSVEDGRPNQPIQVAFVQFDPATGAIRAGSWGVDSITVNVASQDWTIILNANFGSGASAVPETDLDARVRIIGGTGAACRIPQQVASPPNTNSVRINSVDAAGALANATGDVMVTIYRRMGGI